MMLSGRDYADRMVRIYRKRGRNLSGVILPQTRGNPSSRILIRVKRSLYTTLVYVLAYTGARIGEVSGIDLQDVMEKESAIYIRAEKNEPSRMLMRVVGYDEHGLVKTRYVRHPYSGMSSTFHNDRRYLHDPARFGIKSARSGTFWDQSRR
ncbi:MAG: hypothetical protein ACYDAZ_00610 [Thermoplasmataceae archaeon]